MKDLFQNFDFLLSLFLLSWWFSEAAVGEFIFRIFLRIQLFGWDLCVLHQDTFYLNPDSEQKKFLENGVFISFVGPSGVGKMRFFNCASKRNQSTEIWQNFLFSQHSKSEFSDTSKKQRYKVLGSLWRFGWRDLQFKGIVHFATAWRHRELILYHIENTLFHQSTFGQHVEIQNTNIVFFQSHRYVMQVITFSAQLGLGSELVDWYQNAA